MTPVPTGKHLRLPFTMELDTVLINTAKADKIILMGDFNPRVGRNYELWGNTIRKHGVGKTNSNGILLLSICAEHNLVIIRTPSSGRVTNTRPFGSIHAQVTGISLIISLLGLKIEQIST